MELYPDGTPINVALPMSPSIAEPSIKIKLLSTTGEILKPFNDIFPTFFGNVLIFNYFIQYTLHENITEKPIE